MKPDSIFEKIVVLICIALFFVALIGWIVKGWQYLDANRISCFKKYSDYQPEYTLFGGCRIELNGKMTPVEAVRSTDL